MFLTISGARVNALDAYNHGAVEISVMTENLEMLHLLIEMNLSELNVWKRLVKFLSADTEDEAEKVCGCQQCLLIIGVTCV